MTVSGSRPTPRSRNTAWTTPDGDYVFSADFKSDHIEEPRFALRKIEKATGIKATVHDLRRTFVTVAESCDIPVYALKGLVNHSMGTDVTAGYVVAGPVEDQYICTGGQLYELMAGHDRFNADLRPLLEGVLAKRGNAPGINCHPYDICTALIAEEAGVQVTDPSGSPLSAPLDTTYPIAWVGYANKRLKATIEPVLNQLLQEFDLI